MVHEIVECLCQMYEQAMLQKQLQIHHNQTHLIVVVLVLQKVLGNPLQLDSELAIQGHPE